MSELERAARAIPVGSVGARSGGWWGMMALISTEASLFAYLLFSYFYLLSQTGEHWPPGSPLETSIGALNTALLLLSSVFVWLSERLVRARRVRWAAASMGGGLALGLVFAGIQWMEWQNQSYGIGTHQYGSLYFTITGFHVLHVLVGLLILGMLLIWIALGYFDERRNAALKIGGLYWHFVDVVWIFVFGTLYLTPWVF